MSTKHTPGPWVVQGYRIYGPKDERSRHLNGRMLVGGIVDDMNDWRCNPSTSREERSAFVEETTANASLIAAAPELLAALIAAEERAPHGEACAEGDCRCWRRYACAAIEKAQGGRL